MGSNTCLCAENGPGSLLEKYIFDPLFDPFLVPKRSIFKAFWVFQWAKTGDHGLKIGQKHLFEHAKWSMNNSGKNVLFRPEDPGGPTASPHRVRAGLPYGSTK